MNVWDGNYGLGTGTCGTGSGNRGYSIRGKSPWKLFCVSDLFYGFLIIISQAR